MSSISVYSLNTRDCSGKQKLKLFLAGFWPHLGPGRLPLESGQQDVEFAVVFVSVASVVVKFVPECIFWNLPENKS